MSPSIRSWPPGGALACLLISEMETVLSLTSQVHYPDELMVTHQPLSPMPAQTRCSLETASFHDYGLPRAQLPNKEYHAPDAAMP